MSRQGHVTDGPDRADHRKPSHLKVSNPPSDLASYSLKAACELEWPLQAPGVGIIRLYNLKTQSRAKYDDDLWYRCPITRW